MQESKNRVMQSGLTSNSFLVNVMPHIKINQKNFPLKGIDPELKQEISISSWQVSPK